MLTNHPLPFYFGFWLFLGNLYSFFLRDHPSLQYVKNYVGNYIINLTSLDDQIGFLVSLDLIFQILTNFYIADFYLAIPTLQISLWALGIQGFISPEGSISFRPSMVCDLSGRHGPICSFR